MPLGKTRYICVFLLLSAGIAAQSTANTEAGQRAISEARANLGSFSIDITEVTIGQFRNYARKHGIITAAEREGGGFEWGSGWERRRGWTYLAPFGVLGGDNEPAVHISFAEAEAYCKAAGGFLPNKQQWQLAAYTEMRASPPRPFENGRTYLYPTGENEGRANVSGDADGWARHAPVGSTGAGINGLFDAGGNVWEWLSDASGEERLTAGGSWWYDQAKMKVDGMQYKPAKFYAVYVGFRCAYMN